MPARPSGDSSKSASTNCLCKSRSDDMVELRTQVSLLGLGNEYAQRRNIRIPLDQSRYTPEEPHRKAIQVPNGLAYVLVMGIDQHLPVPDLTGDVARQVHFFHCCTG